ncbi:unnamed protein product [Brachionus calyciflorus]|uniref:Endonuclease/exonuclease/phosphatase domain-containing protein n=1 Tax=Brachionus calyciflorus TaxID=104777 RepID=A0A814N0K0_9BILA|nr:unnamed protein product [Brachionus calyciflorus]
MSIENMETDQADIATKIAEIKEIPTEKYITSKNSKRKREEEFNSNERQSKKDTTQLLTAMLDHQNEQDQLIEGLLNENKKLVELVHMLNQKIEKMEKKETPKMNWSNLFKKTEETDEKPETVEKTLQKIEAVSAMSVFSNEMSEREKRKKNLIIVGIEELDGNNENEKKNHDNYKINEILTVMKIDKKRVKEVIRFKSKHNHGKTAPILIKVDSEETKFKILKNSKELRNNSNFNKTFINLDLTPAERLEQKVLRDERKQKNEQEGNNSGYYWAIHNFLKITPENENKVNETENQKTFRHLKEANYPHPTSSNGYPQVPKNQELQTEIQMENLSICSLNCKNLLSNFNYVNELLEQVDIVFLQETWLKTAKQAKKVINKNFKFVHKSSMTPEYSVGRPHGGTGWIINKKFQKNIKIEFISDRISMCQINETYLIRVYMNFEGPTDSVVKLKALVSQILNLIDKIHLNNKDPNICILGDFNTDLEPDYLYTQKTDYTYKQNRIIKNDKDKTEILRCVTSRIDHVLVKENFAKKIEQVNILNEQDHQSNTSDHLAIKIDLKKLNINIEPKQKLKNNTTLTSKINWNDENTQESYAQNLRHKLLNKNIILKLNETNSENSKGNITEIINELGSTMRETIEEITSFNYNSKSINNKHVKKK